MICGEHSGHVDPSLLSRLRDRTIRLSPRDQPIELSVSVIVELSLSEVVSLVIGLLVMAMDGRHNNYPIDSMYRLLLPFIYATFRALKEHDTC